MLNQAERAELLNLARSTLECHLLRRETHPYTPSQAGLLEKKGAFVSLHHGDELRGCIGQLSPDRELYRIVQHCVVCAATEDTRFLPVEAEEIEQLSIEISVLTPFRRIREIEEIEVRKHGLYIVRGPFRGLLLPQVAVQYGWDRITFLKQTCRKSGLPDASWQDSQTAIHIFEAEVFSDQLEP